MFGKLLGKLFGNRQDRIIKSIQPIIEQIKQSETTLVELSDQQLRQRVVDIKTEIAAALQDHHTKVDDLTTRYRNQGNEQEKESLHNQLDKAEQELKKATTQVLESVLAEVFAIVRQTCKRLATNNYAQQMQTKQIGNVTIEYPVIEDPLPEQDGKGHAYNVRGNTERWFMVPFDVQLIGGVILHQGNIAEMATGEGKTLVATLPLFLNALVGKGAHLITVNDYLAQRDSEWMRPIFAFHGLSVGVIYTNMPPHLRAQSYACDVTYGVNSEFGFDYLRDNMATDPEQVVQANHYYAIVDEVDSVLIDEARTPLIISGPVPQSKNYFANVISFVRGVFIAQDHQMLDIARQVRELLKNTDSDSMEIGRLLSMMKMAAPKSKHYLKLLREEPELAKLVSDVESYYRREKKMHELEEELFFVVDEHGGTCELTDKGRDRYSDPGLFMLEEINARLAEVSADPTLDEQQKRDKRDAIAQDFSEKTETLHNIRQLLKAYALFEREVDYIVQNGQVVIVDEFTGRPMPGRRFRDGLHEALEAKEGVQIKDASQTLATITLQNYFKMYNKLAGMTGTAITEENEFLEIYKLPVVEIPTNKPISRVDHDDLVYMTKTEKYKAIIREVEHWYKLGKPVLVGTVSVEVSEILSRMLSRAGIKHDVLNAKYPEKEAGIITRAGEPGAVTIATNMAGRGTDIKLGSGVVTKDNSEYLNINTRTNDENPYGGPTDGLHVIGTERHESRRIDRQLRGRAGRQGDPGTSRFYLSLEDDLMRLFASDRVAGLLGRLSGDGSIPITHPLMTKAVSSAQKRVETRNFEIRKNLLQYDEVFNQQRKVIYTYRHNVLEGQDLRGEIMEMLKDTLYTIVQDKVAIAEYPDQWDFAPLLQWLSLINVHKTEADFELPRMTVENVAETAYEFAEEVYKLKEEESGEEDQRQIERQVLLEVVDEEWRRHLHELDLLRDGIGMRAYGNKDPLIEFKKESFTLFGDLTAAINEKISRQVFNVYRITAEQLSLLRQAQTKKDDFNAYDGIKQAINPAPTRQNNVQHGPQPAPKPQPRVVTQKVGRNDLCPCGSGKKYKKCCGREPEALN